MTTGFAAELRRRRQEARWSQPRLARTVYVTQSFVSKVETGAESPSPEFALACDAALEADGALCALVPARPLAGDAVEVEGWQLMDTLTSSRLSSDAVSHMRTAALSYSTRYPQANPAELLSPVQRQLRRVTSALAQPLPLTVHRDAVRLLGLLAGLAGNLALDAGEESKALGYFQAGRVAGQQADDTDLVAWLLANSSLVPHFAGNQSQALGVLDEALDVAAAGSSPRRRAWLLALRARAAAAAGRDDEALRDLDAAWTALDGADAPDGTDFFDEARMRGINGATYLRLRRLDDAASHLRQACEARAAGDVKGRALLTLDLAGCQLAQGDTQGAEAAVHTALDLAGDAAVAPIRSRTRQIEADMMAIDPVTAGRVRQRRQALGAVA